jgi:hypothetical protein
MARTAASHEPDAAGVIGGRHSPPVGFSRLGLSPRTVAAIEGYERRASKFHGGRRQASASAARSSPRDGLGTSGKDTRLACSGTVSPARPASSLRNSHAISRRRAIGYALDQRFACSLRPTFCAFAPFPATRASTARPPAGTGTGGKDAPRGGSQARPASLQARFSRTRLSYAPSLTATRPSLCGRRIPHF